MEGVRALGRECARDEPAAYTADAETSWLFGSEKNQFDRTARAQAAALEGADGFEAAEHADGAVVHAGVGDGVDVRAGGDGGKIGLGADPAEEGIAHGVFTDDEALGRSERFEPGAGAEIVGGEDDAGDGGALGRWLDGGEGGEGFEFVEEAGCVDLNFARSDAVGRIINAGLHACLLRLKEKLRAAIHQPSGCRFQSL